MTDTATATNNQPQTRLCGTCGRWRPVEQFNRYGKDNPRLRPHCKVCRYDYLKRRRSKRRLHGFLKDMNAIGRRRQVDKLLALLEITYRHYGGLRGLAIEVMHWQKLAKPGSQMAGKILHATLQMVTMAAEEQTKRAEQEEREREERYWAMSDEELQQEHTENLMRTAQSLVAENPEIAVSAAHKLGWTVIPPEDEDDELLDSCD
jgi:hypothetical protein